MHYWVQQASPTHFTIRPRAQAPWAGKPRPTCLSYFFFDGVDKALFASFFYTEWQVVHYNSHQNVFQSPLVWDPKSLFSTYFSPENI